MEELITSCSYSRIWPFEKIIFSLIIFFCGDHMHSIGITVELCEYLLSLYKASQQKYPAEMRTGSLTDEKSTEAADKEQ